MSDASKPPSRMSPIVAALIAVVVAGLLGLAAGAKVDDLVRPTPGPTGAIVAGFGSAFAVLVGLGVVCYRGLTR